MFIRRGKANSVTEVVLARLGLTLNEYLNPDTTPFLKNLKEAADLIRWFISEFPDGKITIVGDYDADGINATAIMYHMIRMLTGKAPATRLPHRFSEGYGLSEKIIDEIQSGLVITVDNGIAAHDAIAKAKSKGLYVLVTDHHIPVWDKDGNAVLPPADVVFDPAADNESEYKDYCGAALAYRLACELMPDRSMKKLLVFASIATVADVMPITGANWKLTKDGLKALNSRICMPGLAALVDKLGLDDHIQADDYGFKLGPCYNATGRLYDNGAEIVLELLKHVTSDPRMPWRADKLIKANEDRKKIVKEAMERLTIDGERPIVYVDKALGEGVIGIIAGQIAEREYCPAIVFTESEPGVLKGSGRSIPEVNLKAALDKMSDTMIGYGGHAGAAGLAIKEERLDDFIRAFKESCGTIPERPTDVFYDLDLDMQKLPDIVDEMNALAPFGEGNPMPVFRTTLSLDPSSYKVIGDGTHFMVRMGAFTVCGFGQVKKYEDMGKPEKIDAVVKVSQSWFRGRASYRLELVDFQAV